MRNVDTFLAQLKKFNSDELRLIAENILSTLKCSQFDQHSQQSSITLCRKCGTENSLSKYGKDKNGKQRYRCKHCGVTFTETSYSTIAHSHCSASTWETYIECLLQG